MEMGSGRRVLDSQSMNNDDILVAVYMITYNHESYITQAIEGVLMQKTNFDYELIISNDCSIDNTDKIIKNIIDTNPKGYLIKYYNQKKNIGMNANFFFATDKCNGEYMAFCEGDDYWIDTL
ncbi:MAG: glycosyltransferase, partial [Flavobacterium sp.]